MQYVKIISRKSVYLLSKSVSDTLVQKIARKDYGQKAKNISML